MTGAAVTAACPKCKAKEETDESRIICVECGEEYDVTDGNYC